MDIKRLTSLVGADPDEVEALILEIEKLPPSERARRLGDLGRAMGFGEPARAEQQPAGRPRAAERTDLADAAAMDLGFD